MKVPCERCRKRKICVEPCEKLEKLLPPDISMKERPVSGLLRGEENEDRIDVPDIDKIRKIDPAAVYGAEEDQHATWDMVPGMTALDWTSEDMKVFKKHIEEAIPYGQTKLKRRFYSFLRCEKMTDIARRANTSKQNIWKAFQKVIERISKSYWRETKVSTPLKFKAMVHDWE